MHILVVDDEPLTRLSLADFLAESGYEVSTADCGQAAIALQQQNSFDICIVDLRMPGMDGIETIQALHRLTPSSQFIIYTGSPHFTLPPTLQKLGMTDAQIVHKPLVDLDAFLSLIDNLTTTTLKANPT